MPVLDSGCKVVYIESNRTNARKMGELMKDSEPGCILRAFRSGGEAIELLCHPMVEPPDMILLGDACGGMTPFDLLRRIHGIAQMRDVPVLMVGVPDRAAIREHLGIIRALMGMDSRKATGARPLGPGLLQFSELVPR